MKLTLGLVAMGVLTLAQDRVTDEPGILLAQAPAPQPRPVSDPPRPPAARPLEISGPSPNVELTVYLLSGATQGAASDDAPQDLAATVRQLHSLFNYKSYKLSESFVLRGRSSGERENAHAQTEGILPGDGLHYNFSYQRVRVPAEKPRMVRIDGLQIDLYTPRVQPDGKMRRDTVASIHTDLDLAEGQKTVVGKSSINNAGDALILVIVPKVIE